MEEPEISHARGHHRRLGGAAAVVPQQREGHLDEVVTGPGLVEQGAEQHEEEDEAGGDPQGDAEDPLGRQPLVVDQAVEAYPPVSEDARHMGPEQRIDDKHRGHDRKRRPQGAARRLQQQQDAHHADHHVLGQGRPGPLGELGIEEEHIGATEGGDPGEQPILQRNALPGRALQRRIGHKGQEEREGQVNGARLGGIEDPEPEEVGQGRRDPQLEQRPGRGDTHQQLAGRPQWLARPGVGGGHHLLQVDFRALRSLLVVCHKRFLPV